MKVLLLGALLLSGCASVLPGEIACRDWNSRDVHVLVKKAMTSEFVCQERICYALHSGACYYNCPEERMPKVCR